MKILRKKRTPTVLFVLMLVVVAACSFAWVAGKSDGYKAKDRLEILWPNLMTTMPEEDKIFLVKLAAGCRLANVETNKDDVVTCLKSVAVKNDADNVKLTYLINNG